MISSRRIITRIGLCGLGILSGLAVLRGLEVLRGLGILLTRVL